LTEWTYSDCLWGQALIICYRHGRAEVQCAYASKLASWKARTHLHFGFRNAECGMSLWGQALIICYRHGRAEVNAQGPKSNVQSPIKGDVAAFVALRCPTRGRRMTPVSGCETGRCIPSQISSPLLPAAHARATPGRLAPSHLQPGARGTAPCPPAVGVEVSIRIATVRGRSEESAILPPTAQSSITGRRRRQEACQPE
jgi:hypothetical protein